MESNSTFLELPLLPINKILTFLNTREVYFVLARLCRKLNNLLKTSTHLPLQFVSRLVNESSENTKRLMQIPKQQLMGFLKQIFSNIYQLELPYYGFKTDGGCYDGDSNFFMDRVFQSYYGGKYTAYSSLEGNEFHVEGVLAFDYLESKDLLEFFHPIEEKDYKLIQDYKLYAQKDRSNLEEVMAKVSNSSDRYNIEITYFPLENITGIITSIEFKRPRNYTCITKTILLYCSEDKIEFSDPLIKLFAGAKAAAHLISLYQSSSKDLPQIEATNIDELKKFAHEPKYSPKVLPPEKAEVILFSNKQKSKVQAVAWIRIKDPDLLEIIVDLKKNNCFTGNYVVGKLLDRDTTNVEEPNYDLKSISLKGFLFPPNESLIKALTDDQPIKPLNPEKILRLFEPYSQDYSPGWESDNDNLE